MRHLAYIALLALVSASCSSDGQRFKLDGRLLNLNQGEFYVYSPDGGLDGPDTISVVGGRFSYETTCERPTLLMIILPNYTTQPVFAEPGRTAKLRGDASHLKEMTVKGSKDNELMTAFRQQTDGMNADETAAAAVTFVQKHPTSAVGAYLVLRYFIYTDSPDYVTAGQLIDTMLARQEHNGFLRRLQRFLQIATTTAQSNDIPVFTATSIGGDKVTEQLLTERGTAVVCSWATWKHESMSEARQLGDAMMAADSCFNLLLVSIDGDPKTAARVATQRRMHGTIVCDGDMIDGTVYRSLGLIGVPDNILIKDGKIVARHLKITDLTKQLPTSADKDN